MYFHGCVETCKGQQRSFVATSRDGISFTARPTPLGPSYFRVFRHDGFHYAIALEQNAGVLLRSRDGLAPFERGPALIPRMRHAALRVEGERLVLFYSRRRDAPERILRSVVLATFVPISPGSVLVAAIAWRCANLGSLSGEAQLGARLHSH